ncbi:hypothetical protein [Bifidobacterium leontopitheci]|uniref:Uncharacterized protein n=1 Tax=Bifidobacterium leontopitheci TaxID=2650774 RepID=A0A6I1GGH4_9BIFI|nr:hypothetical protein [Bifidobacterium leontopitheci]KAB7790675.1 hypothetical protein F7D09_0781 [Bifidobacterium leontopitheci]
MGLFNSDSGDGKPFSHAIPGTEQLATTLKDTVGAFASGLGVKPAQSTCVCEGCGAPLSGARHETVQCPYCDRRTQLP